MSDNLRRCRAIRDALTRLPRHLITLRPSSAASWVARAPTMPHIAAKVPNGTKPESRVKRFARWLDNAHLLEEVYFVPYADVLLRHLAWQTLVLVMDDSRRGPRGHRADDPCSLYRASPAAGLAGAPSPAGPLSRRSPSRLGRPHQRADPSRDAGGVAGRWRMRWDEAAANAAAGGLVLRVSHGHEHGGDVGGRDLPPGGARRVSQTGQSSARRFTTRARRMAQSWCGVVGPRGITSRCIESAIWPRQRKPVPSPPRATFLV